MEVILSKEYVYSLLDEKKIAKAKFARLIGIQRTNLEALLDSKKKDINVVIKMAEALGMSLQEFIGFSPCDFKIKGYVKIGEELREIKTEEDWYKAEQDSGVCTIPYYRGFDDACTAIDSYLNKALNEIPDSAIMGRVGTDAVFCISSATDCARDESDGSLWTSKRFIVSIKSKAKGMTTHAYSTIEYEGDHDYLIEEIKGEIRDLFVSGNFVSADFGKITSYKNRKA